jgi:hypothetical protein
MTLKSMTEPTDDDHDCDGEGVTDSSLCGGCRDHAGFCSVCELSECCGAHPLSFD